MGLKVRHKEPYFSGQGCSLLRHGYQFSEIISEYHFYMRIQASALFLGTLVMMIVRVMHQVVVLGLLRGRVEVSVIVKR
jgi:hypothetical protein